MRRISFDTYDSYETSYSPESLVTVFTGIKSLKRQKLILEEELTPCTVLSGRYISDKESYKEETVYFVNGNPDCMVGTSGQMIIGMNPDCLKELHICGTIELKRFAEIRHRYDMFLSTGYPYIGSLK